ncbi:MAG: ATP-dependent DNA helicase [Candidatus Omnitrophota bacterium]|nr:ATP-dependent DNA helicase [Candidatus Omnitrophota bacterium]
MSFSMELFREGGIIARNLAGYEIRPQQMRMAEAVEQAISEKRNLLVEAGAGVGKSLAYLVPFVRWAVEENKKVVISTYTKTLQNQLFVKDLPFLSRVMDHKFRYALCMGSENYVCMRKARKNSTPDLFEEKQQKKQVENITGWLSRTETGLVTDMDFVPGKTVWARFSREADMCMGKKCPFEGQCFFRKARRSQAMAHVLVVNHALLFTNMMSGSRLLPEFNGLVLDEAHTLEDVATGHLGREVSNLRLYVLLGGIQAFAAGGAFARGSSFDQRSREIKDLVNKARSASEKFFNSAKNIFGKNERIIRLEEEPLFHNGMSAPLAALSLSLMTLSRDLDDPEIREEAKAHAERCDSLSEALDFIFDDKDKKYVRWIDVRNWKRGTNYSFHAAPIDISGQMKMYLFEKVSPIVLTSATLSSSAGEAGFSFIKSRLGLEGAVELMLDSPFDYEKNVLMYLPRGVNDPNNDYDSFEQRVREDIIGIYDIMGGRIFALFTSYEMLNAVASGIAGERGDINILKQGDLPRYVLLDVFKKSQESILMGTTTFWQGVDVPGTSLECVIITRLPFSVPTDPVNAARIKSIKDRGLNPFREYQIPQAVIMFKQGFGRLIRHHSDRGIVAVMDSRIRTRDYGRDFLRALPECRKTEDMDQIREFFRSS